MTKILCSIDMRREMNRIPGEDHSIGQYRINKIYLSSQDDKKIYLRKNIVRYRIFINLLVKSTRSHKNNFVKYKQFVFIFALIRTAILLLFFFSAL